MTDAATEILTGQAFADSLNKQKSRHRDIDQRRNRANARLEEVKSRYKKLAEDALRLFGTDDVEKLKALVAQREQENHDSLVAYTKELAAMETQTQALEQALAMTGDRGNSGVTTV